MRKSPLGPHHTLFLRKKKKIKKSFISSRGRRRGKLQFVVRIPSVRPSLAGFPLRSYKEKENTHIIPFHPRFPIMSPPLFFSIFPFYFPVEVQSIPHFVRLKKIVRVGSPLRQELQPMCVICAFLCALYPQL